MGTLVTALRDAIANLIDDQVNTGSGTATIVFQTSADATLATLNMSNPAFGAASSGVITANTITAANAGASGTASKAKIVNRNGTDLITGITVGASGAEINFSSVTWSSGDQISVSSLTITAVASTV